MAASVHVTERDVDTVKQLLQQFKEDTHTGHDATLSIQRSVRDIGHNAAELTRLIEARKAAEQQAAREHFRNLIFTQPKVDERTKQGAFGFLDAQEMKVFRAFQLLNGLECLKSKAIEIGFSTDFSTICMACSEVRKYLGTLEDDDERADKISDARSLVIVYNAARNEGSTPRSAVRATVAPA